VELCKKKNVKTIKFPGIYISSDQVICFYQNCPLIHLVCYCSVGLHHMSSVYPYLRNVKFDLMRVKVRFIIKDRTDKYNCYLMYVRHKNLIEGLPKKYVFGNYVVFGDVGIYKQKYEAVPIYSSLPKNTINIEAVISYISDKHQDPLKTTLLSHKSSHLRVPLTENLLMNAEPFITEKDGTGLSYSCCHCYDSAESLIYFIVYWIAIPVERLDVIC